MHVLNRSAWFLFPFRGLGLIYFAFYFFLSFRPGLAWTCFESGFGSVAWFTTVDLMDFYSSFLFYLHLHRYIYIHTHIGSLDLELGNWNASSESISV